MIWWYVNLIGVEVLVVLDGSSLQPYQYPITYLCPLCASPILHQPFSFLSQYQPIFWCQWPKQKIKIIQWEMLNFHIKITLKDYFRGNMSLPVHPNSCLRGSLSNEHHCARTLFRASSTMTEIQNEKVGFRKFSNFHLSSNIFLCSSFSELPC